MNTRTQSPRKRLTIYAKDIAQGDEVLVATGGYSPLVDAVQCVSKKSGLGTVQLRMQSGEVVRMSAMTKIAVRR